MSSSSSSPVGSVGMSRSSGNRNNRRRSSGCCRYCFCCCCCCPKKFLRLLPPKSKYLWLIVSALIFILACWKEQQRYFHVLSKLPSASTASFPSELFPREQHRHRHRHHRHDDDDASAATAAAHPRATNHEKKELKDNNLIDKGDDDDGTEFVASSSSLLSYNATRFHETLQHFLAVVRSGDGSTTTTTTTTPILVMIVCDESSSSTNSTATIMDTIHDALISPYAHIVVIVFSADSEQQQHNLAHKIQQSLSEGQQQPATALETGQVQVINIPSKQITTATNTTTTTSSNSVATRRLLRFAYTLELAYQVNLPYTLFLQPGNRLIVQQQQNSLFRRRSRNNDNDDYVTMALQHVEQIQKKIRMSTDYDSLLTANRTCYTEFSSSSSHGALLVETREHAHRMSVLLQSLAPYQQQRVHSLLRDCYCDKTLYETEPDTTAPHLFEMSTLSDAAAATTAIDTTWDTTMNTHNFADDDDDGLTSDQLQQELQFPSIRSEQESPSRTLFTDSMDLPPWMDPFIRYGPQQTFDNDNDGNNNKKYWITFGVNTMPRVDASEYLEQFMTELLDIVQNDFVVEGKQQQAQIVLLACGNSTDALESHYEFLQRRYRNEIDKHLVRLEKATLWEETLSNRTIHRRTFRGENDRRRYWRSKQNLDVANVLSITKGTSDYVMLLEDDTGFQPGFADALKETMGVVHNVDAEKNSGMIPPPWSVAEFGFGYSGVLIHSSDVPVLEHLHATFFDEMPCDVFRFKDYIRDGWIRQVLSPTSFSNEQYSYLRHLGKQSTLPGIVRDIW